MPSPELSNQPKYLAIAAELRGGILAGRYAPGSRLPGENQVMQDHAVARATARQALSQLINWGLAEARKGSGIYVREFKPIVRDGIRRLGGDTWPAGQSIWTAESDGRDLAVDQVEVSETNDVPVHIRTLLNLQPDASVVRRSRRYVLDGKPVLLSSSWLPSSIATGTPIAERDTGHGGTYARLSELGRKPVRFREELRSLMPGPKETEQLELAPGTPSIEIVRVAYDAEGNPVEVNEMTADASAYIFRYEFDA